MTTCMKCQYERQPADAAPNWQCPACGVAYVKAARASVNASPAFTDERTTAKGSKTGAKGRSWATLLAIAAVSWGAWSGVQNSLTRHGVFVAGSELSVAELSALASTVKADEVQMYSTTECPNCAQAKAWLHEYGFPFTECNMSVSAQCEQEFLAVGGDGTPYLIVRGHHMRDGFDSDEFLAALEG